MLHSRCADVLFAVFFLIFTLICAFCEAPVCLGETVSPDSTDPVVAYSYGWGLKADMVWVKQPHWSRIAVCFHCFGFGPFYALLCLTFLFRWQWMRTPGLLVTACKLYAGAYYMTTNLLHPEYPPAQPELFVAQSLSYMLIPFLACIRFTSSNPFPSSSPNSKPKSS